MSGAVPQPPARDASASSLASALQAIVRHRGVQTAVALWVCGTILALWLAHGSLPFDRPAVAKLPVAMQVVGPSVALIEVGVLMLVAFFVTRGRVIPDMTARAPERWLALRETVLVLGYAALGQVGGWLVGPWLGYRPFSFHLAGSMFGGTMTTRPADVWIWSCYNFVVFALVPYIYFRRRYSNTALNLRSSDRRKDALLILMVLVIESAVELVVFQNNIVGLSWHQVLVGAPLSFAIFFIGTVLPTMVLIYAILLPRYLKLTRSAISTVLLGGLTYAAMHLVEGWSVFDSPRDMALSLIFVLFQYFGPGMIKSVLTLRTGNAWVHALGYHAIAPHVIVDTPLVVRIFGITS